ncbi:hypothetical protein EYZ11_008918 [Aspergillus tanneri]|uniref:Uncharacterized protein n=1 Tax=Aspergillus tanneri TaxID=1220188 RepID=A0A4S3J977_9EURO|nr:hypothetical protein EYZ11_008918 [Aspergillus tanneri]
MNEFRRETGIRYRVGLGPHPSSVVCTK